MASPAIVVIDHDPMYLELIQEILTAEGYPSVSCVPYADAWSCIVREEPALVCLAMPLLNLSLGWALLDKLRLQLPTAAIPVILTATDIRLLTAKASHLQRLNCFILEKPFLIEDLLALVATLIGPPPERAA